VVKNTKWNQSYQELIAAGIQNMPLASVKRLVRLANDFVYTGMIYTKIIVNELNMPIEKKTIKPALDIGGIAGGEKYVIQGSHSTRSHARSAAHDHLHCRHTIKESSSSSASTRRCRTRVRACGCTVATIPRKRRPPKPLRSSCKG
jgi:hypothetical protein